MERFRMRKLMQHQQQSSGEADLNNSFTSSICYDDSDEVTSIFSGNAASRPGRMAPTPSSMAHRTRSSSLCSGARRRSIAPLPTSRASNSMLLPPSMSQETISTINNSACLSQESQPEKDDLLVENAVLRSRLKEMEQRFEKIENEKIALSMSKAPLEARLRQNEDEWTKKYNMLQQDYDSLKKELLVYDQSLRDVKLERDAAVEENQQLRLENRKATSVLTNNNNGSKANVGSATWQRHLQQDSEVTELKEKLRSTEAELNYLRLEKVSVEKELHANKIELESLARNHEDLQNDYSELAGSSSDNRDAIIQLEVLTEEHVATSAQLNAVYADLAATKARAEAAMMAKENEYKEKFEQLQFENSVLKTRAGTVTTSGDFNDSVEDVAVLKARIEERDRRVAELEASVLKYEELRRQMHNRIQELRGNIRVFVRTRPFLPNDGKNLDPAIDVCPDGESLTISDARHGGDVNFKFDKVFPPSAGQDQVFQEVADFVQSALDGYQVCLFSYGQTGSGKTHTMQGSGNSAMRGIIPRAVEQILNQARQMHKQKWDFQLCASFLEIYNENLKDLLLTMGAGNSRDPPKLAIKRDREGKSYVENLTEVPIETTSAETGAEQLEKLMAVAARARSVASTKMNAQSSRSHSVFMLHIRGSNAETGAMVQGSLNLCDLAGSERLDRSGAADDAKRLKETQSINKSLSCLGDVFNALAQRANHVPYRNSKLTYLLQDCLSGDGKALMFVNLSPTTASSNESLCSLRFAQRVNQVELGKPTKNIQYSKR